MLIADAFIWVVVVAFLVCVYLVYRAARGRLEEQDSAQQMADAAFEAQVLGSTRSAEAVDSFSFPPQVPAPQVYAAPERPQDVFQALESQHAVTAPTLPQHTAAPYSSDSIDDFYRQPADVTCAGVIAQLRNAGMLEQLDSFVELNGNPKAAAVLRLKGGRFALVLPYQETEAFTRRNLKKYQMLLYVGRDGKASVVTSLEETIAARVAGSAGF